MSFRAASSKAGVSPARASRRMPVALHATQSPTVTSVVCKIGATTYGHASRQICAGILLGWQCLGLILQVDCNGHRIGLVWQTCIRIALTQKHSVMWDISSVAKGTMTEPSLNPNRQHSPLTLQYSAGWVVTEQAVEHPSSENADGWFTHHF